MKVIILVGLTGSGKTTIATTEYKDYYRINQDELGNRDNCIKEFTHALSKNKNVIIDRTNINKKQRKYFIDIALQYGVNEIHCVNLVTDPEECIARIHFRKNHPTISENMDLSDKREIVYKFFKSYERPELDEGFTSILFKRS